MNPLEAATLCKLAKAACPQQAIDEYTPDAWFPLLQDLRFEDAKDGLFAVVKRQPFVAPAEIRDEVKRLRGDRIRAFGPLPNPPEEIGADSGRYSRWMSDMYRRIGDGEIVAAPDLPPNLEQQERVMAAIDGVFQEVPDE